MATKGKKSSVKHKKKQGRKKNPVQNPPKEKIEEPVVPEKKQRAPRRKITLESHNERYDHLLLLVNNEIERKKKEREKGIRALTTIRKEIVEMQKEVPKITKAKRRINNANKVSGFMLQCKITEEMADFLQIPHDSTVSRNEITNAICTYARIKDGENRPQILKWAHLNPGGERDLQNPERKMAIIPDETLRKLLRYDSYVADVEAGKITYKKKNKETGIREDVVVTDSALIYCTIQKLIGVHIIKTLKREKVQEIEMIDPPQ